MIRMEAIVNNAHKVIEEFSQNKDYTNEVLFITRLRALGFDIVQIAKVIKAMESVCPTCYNAHSGCKCWNDIE